MVYSGEAGNNGKITVAISSGYQGVAADYPGVGL
jgi:hypothetical protein